jgi:zinc transporter ZupT
MLLVAAIAALLAGPLIVSLGAIGLRASAFIDGFVFITVAGLFLFGVLPEASRVAGPAAWAWAAAGFVVPVLLESGFVQAARRAHRAILALGVAALVLHQLLDGVALVSGGEPAGSHAHDHGPADDLALAVIFHNLPVGVAVWFLLAPNFGVRLTLVVFAVLAGGTAAGFLVGPGLLALLEAPGVAAAQALLAGSILHVVLHGMSTQHQHQHQHGPGPGHGPATVATAGAPPRWAERLGVLAGLGLLSAWL